MQKRAADQGIDGFPVFRGQLPAAQPAEPDALFGNGAPVATRFLALARTEFLQEVAGN